MEWTISIEGKNEFGDICRREVRIDKCDERLCDGDLAYRSLMARRLWLPCKTGDR